MKLLTIAWLKLLLACVGLLVALIGAFLFVGWPTKTPDVSYGMTFSRPYAEELGLDADHVLAVALDDVGIRRFRMAAYWKLIEPTEGTWDFTSLDRDIAAVGQRGGKVVLAIGEKLPRWPECWGPDWWKKLQREDQRQKTLRYLETVVTRYRDNTTILAWQVENEPHFQYGDCPAPDYLFIQRETQFVHGLDPTRKIYTTDSGELSTWLTLGVFVDKLGVSVYRVVRNPLFGNVNLQYWFVPPYLYKRKSILLRPFGVQEIYVSEFQMEPWSNKPLLEGRPEDLDTGDGMGIPAIDFWGIEWWVWMKDKAGHPELLDEAAKFYQSHR